MLSLKTYHFGIAPMVWAIVRRFARSLFWAAVPCAVLACVFLAPASASAQSATFSCTGAIYQVQSGQLRIFDTQTSSYTDIGPKNPGYNSLAYNPRDNFLYATQGKNLIRVDANGIVTVLFSTDFNSYIGDMDDDNNIYLRRNSSTMTRVNVLTREITDIPLSTGLASGAADWAFVDTPQGRRLIAPGRTQLSLIDAETGQNTVRTIADFPPEGSSGATWSDVNGRVFTFRNSTGNVYEILDYLTASPRAVLVAVGTPSNSNDGSSCRRRPFPNFPPIAFDDTYTTRFETVLSSVNMILGSADTVDNDPDGGPVEVQPDLIALPENGSVIFQSDGGFTYTPVNGFSGVDRFTYEIADASGLTAQAVVTITVTRPRLSVEKQSGLHESSKLLTPGNEVIYSIVIANSGDQEVDPNSIFIVDSWPADLEFHYGDIDAGGSSQFQSSDPVAWEEEASGLEFEFDRDVAFSNQTGQPTSFSQCTYQPTNGYDTNVRYICIKPKGALLPTGRAQFSMRGRIE